jgi:hypothetical protein
MLELGPLRHDVIPGYNVALPGSKLIFSAENELFYSQNNGASYSQNFALFATSPLT